jgi:hypothetical protein
MAMLLPLPRVPGFEAALGQRLALRLAERRRRPSAPGPPFDATGQRCVRFAARDEAGNGAMIMPIQLPC